MQSDYNDLTVVKLKALCKEQNLPISGRKSELIERLIANDNSKYDNEEEIEQTTEEGTEEKKKFKCIECSTVLRVPLTYKGMISCPTCSTRQEVGEEVKDHPLDSFEFTAEQIGTALMISGILLFALAMWLIVSGWNIWLECEWDNLSLSEYEDLGCGEGSFTNTLFTSCCVLIPLGFLIGMFGYNYSESKQVGLQGQVNHATGITMPSQAPKRSPLVGAIQATAVGYGIGIVTLIGIVLIVIVLILVLILFIAASY